MLSRVKKAVKDKIREFIDDQITKNLSPFLEVGQDRDGNECSDFIVNDDGDISIENMFLKPAIVNDVLIKAGSPLRVAMVRCKRIFLDIPWGDISAGSWCLEVEDLMIVVYPLERESWDVLRAIIARGGTRCSTLT